MVRLTPFLATSRPKGCEIQMTEKEMTQRYWEKVGGTLFEQFLAMSAGRTVVAGFSTG